MREITIRIPTLRDARRAARLLTCRLRGHVPPPDVPTAIGVDVAVDSIASFGALFGGPRYCQRCGYRMPGDPPTPMERFADRIFSIRPVALGDIRAQIAGGAVVYREATPGSTLVDGSSDAAQSPEAPTP